ncbi:MULTISPECIES: GNAT family N-acetyltransferase [Enterococcus]|uniref:Ribosomal-protein-alanine N-acetyltransferase n=1 Tax=Candidatus Enterococcus mangumiae TaxID=2230878 RepID=A0ABZ2SVQ7_9ENTE|nr:MULTISPECIES: GNAT family N-acetyltransferase [unclassified Enterococcus]MBO0461481.1 GNAT family N-acetyltransferase [Enterococcus sp. DIV1298c]MBO0489209.1 GNAT family N-acetyltransferase [Enterococcus sp. DIV1094]MBO1298607.1 GNAT family N-acetyltransferase [Enterococcus sp. DIV1271a]
MELLINRNLVFAENRVIETERLILRPVALEDSEDIFEYAHDEETCRFVFPRHQSIEDTKINVANFFMTAPLGKYAIEWKENGKMIGTIDLRIQEGDDTGELGYALNKKYWGKGIMPEAGKALIDLGFEKMGLVRIFAYYNIKNSKSGRVMDKLGMREEAVIPDAKREKGELISMVLKGITQKMWLESKQKTS